VPEFSENGSSAKQAEEFFQMFKKSAEFTQELLKENECLRYQLRCLQEPTGQAGLSNDEQQPELIHLRNKISELEREKQAILDRIEEIEAENLDFANRCVVIQSENNILANLYLASYQLHSTLDFFEVIKIIKETIVNLIGAEEFALFLLDEKAGKFQLAGYEGIDPKRLAAVELDDGVIGTVGRTGEKFFLDVVTIRAVEDDGPMVCMPLKIRDNVIGVIAIYKLFQANNRFFGLDQELFILLAGHAVTAVFASRLYSDSERKLSTIQGFIKILTN